MQTDHSSVVAMIIGTAANESGEREKNCDNKISFGIVVAIVVVVDVVVLQGSYLLSQLPRILLLLL